MTQTTDIEPQDLPKASKTSWKKAALHEGIALPSGQTVSIRLPNLATLIESGELPNQLIDEALEQRNSKKITRETLLKTWEFAKFIVPRTVIEPKIASEDVGELPIEDIELIAAFASRATDLDAVGRQLGGLERVRSFRAARGLISIDEVIADV